MLQRLLDRLQRRQRIVQLLLARQPMLRRTVVGRRMLRAYGPLLAMPVADDRVAFAPNPLPLPAEPQPTIPAVADLLPEPLIDSPTQSQAAERPRTVMPPVAARPSAPQAVSGQRQVAPTTNPQLILGPDARPSVPQAVRSQQPAIPVPRSIAPPAFSALPAEPFVGDVAAEQVPIPAANGEPAVAIPAPISAMGEQAVPPEATVPLVSGPLPSAPPIVPAPANPDPATSGVPDPMPARRRRAQITELPVAPEVAKSLAQAAGERYTPPPATTTSERSGAAVPPQDSAAELFTSTPARSPQEWARMLFGETNTAAQPTPAAVPQPEPTIATEPAADVVSTQTALEPVEQVEFASDTRPVQPTQPTQVEPAEQVEQVEFASDTRPVQPTQPTPIADPVVAAGIDLPSDVAEQQMFTASDALSDPAPIPSVSVSEPTAVPIPPVSVSAPNEDASVAPMRTEQPLASVPIAPSVATSALPTLPATTLPAAESPASEVSAMQRMIERASAVLRNEAQAQLAQPYPAQPPANPAVPPSADIVSAPLRADAIPTPLPRVDSNPAEGQASVQIPGSVAESPVNDPAVQEPVGVLPESQGAPAPNVAAQSVADPASALPPIGAPVTEEPTAPSPREQTPSRRSRFEEIPASARQPAPQPIAPSGERKLNPRPWIPQQPPEIPQMTNELFEGSGRSAQDWAKLLFQATNPNAWGRQPQPAADPQPPAPAPAPSMPASPPTTDRPATNPSVQQPAQPPTQRQDANRPIAAPVGRPATETAVPVPRRQSTAAQPQATPLRDSTRRFLRPIVGIDPGDVRIYRGVEGARMTEAFRAEGVSRGDEIALGPGNEDESRPETLGLLAHELTHAAQRTDPGFVPPIVAGAAGGVAPAASAEQVARAAERQAVGAARRFIAPIAAGAQVQVPGIAPVGDAPGEPNIPGTNSLFGDVRSPQATPDRTHWGDLPAPWEPLPDWIGGPVQEPGIAANTGSMPSAPNQGLPGATATVAASNAVPAVPATYLADIDRDIPGGEAVAPPEPQQQAAPAADLDAMARQVYGMLKQRLAAERRRLGS